jgi:hypothetical protein
MLKRLFGDDCRSVHATPQPGDVVRGTESAGTAAASEVAISLRVVLEVDHVAVPRRRTGEDEPPRSALRMSLR